MNILLVEPDIKYKSHPNLALMRLSTKHKRLGDNVMYIKGNNYFISLAFSPDIIYISTIFTYYSKEYIETINFYKNSFPKAKIEVGGIFATLMPDYIKEKTGITPFTGVSRELDRIPPDYTLYKEFIKYTPSLEKYKDFSLVVTMRGCPRHCSFCAVKKIEPAVEIIENWKESVDLTKKYIMFNDNNLTYGPMEHFKDVMNFIINNKLVAYSENGFDARIMTEEHMELISKVKWYPGGLRLAFDNMSADGYVQKVIKRLKELGVPKSAFLVFCLYNFNDTLEQANYRMREIANLGARPYPQLYRKLDVLDKKDLYVDKNWKVEDLRMVQNYWLLIGRYTKISYEEYKASVKK